MQCYEGKDKFIQKSILNALWSVMRGTTWTLQCIKNVIICTLIFQSISFESALNTLLFPTVLKLKQTWPLFFWVSLLNAISFKHTTQASLTAQNPHTSTTIHCLQKLSNRRPRSPQLCSTPHPSTPHPILTTYPPHTPPSPSPPKMWVAWEASSNWREGPNLPWLENLSHLQQTFSSLLKYELTREQSSTRK